jgi:hypothetical protein
MGVMANEMYRNTAVFCINCIKKKTAFASSLYRFIPRYSYDEVESFFFNAGWLVCVYGLYNTAFKQQKIRAAIFMHHFAFILNR